MANTITPTPSGSGIRVCTVGTGKQYADFKTAVDYAKTQNPISEGVILCFEIYENQSPPTVDMFMPGGTTNSDYYVIFRFVPGFNQSYDGDGVAVNSTNSGGTLTFNSATPSFLQAGIVFEDMNVKFSGTAATHALKVQYNFSSRNQTFRRCRIIVDLTNSYAIETGNNNSTLVLEDSLVFFGSTCTSALYKNIQGNVFESRNTYIRLGSPGYVGIGSAFGNKTDCVYSNSQGSSYGFTDGSTTYATCISDNASDTRTGFTIVDPVTMFSASNDFRPKTNGSLINKAGASAQNTNDLFNKSRGTNPNAGAVQRDFLPGAPQGTFSDPQVIVTTGNTRRVIVSGTTTGTPTSVMGSLTPTSKSGNHAVAQNAVTGTVGNGTFSIVFNNVAVGEYTQTVTLTNSISSSSVSGNSTVNVVGADGVITSQPPPSGQQQTVSGTTTGNPLSGRITFPANAAAADGNTDGPFSLTLGSGTFTGTFTLTPGTKDAPIYDFTMEAGTSISKNTGGSAVFINGISGNPQAPEPGNPTPGDTTSPTLTSPTGAASGTTTATVGVTTNEANGTLYGLVNTAATASEAAIKGGLSQAITSVGAKSFSVTGLTANTQYYAHFVHVDAAGNTSNIVNSAAFTTQSVPVTPTPNKIVYLVNGRLCVSIS